MKASRLLALLLLLQVRQRMTTAEIAERLEVSPRTVLRDVEALSHAGVPVYAERGRRGGIVLVSGARINVSHLNPDEIDVLRMTGLDARAIEMLGLDRAARTAGLKLAARAVTRPLSPRGLNDVVVVDNAGWSAAEAGEQVALVTDLAESLLRGKRLRIDYRRSGESGSTTMVVDPYGLAVKGGRWYLVADDDGDPRLFALLRLGGFVELSESWTHRTGETLTTVWTDLKNRLEAAGPVAIGALLRTTRLDLARRILGARLTSATAANDDWSLITVRYDDLESVRQLLQFGDHIRVLDPPQARVLVRELAQDLIRHHDGPVPDHLAALRVAALD